MAESIIVESNEYVVQLENNEYVVQVQNNVYEVKFENGINLYSGFDKQYEHIQSSASATWTVAHNLGKVPSVSVIDSSGKLVFGGVQHTDANNTILTFSAPFAGKAYFN